MTFFILWTVLFAMEFHVLKSNTQDVKSYEGIHEIFKYVIFAFENGIGNINPPTVEEWYFEEKTSITQSVLIYLIYIFWIMSQYIMLIVLLNFVIALLSGVYEQVMDYKMIYEFKQKGQLNAEADRFFDFIRAVKSCGQEQETVDQVLLINCMSEEVEQEEWEGIM
jgi:ABC-type multidrug transport system fused ATPase/permease subunit